MINLIYQTEIYSNGITFSVKDGTDEIVSFNVMTNDFLDTQGLKNDLENAKENANKYTKNSE